MNNDSKRFNINYYLVIGAYIGLFYFGLIDNGRGPAYPSIIKDLNLTNWGGSLFFAFSSLMSFITTILSSFWLKKLKLMQGMKVSWLFLSLSAFCLGLCGLWESQTLLYLASIIQGVGMGITGMNMNLMIEAGAPSLYRRRFFGGLHATYGIASFSAPLLFTISRNFKLVWEEYFFLLGTIGITLLFFFPLFFTTTNGDEFSYEEPKDETIPISFLYLLAISLCVGMYVASEIVVSSRLVLFLETLHSMPNNQANLYLSSFFILLMIGRLMLGFINIPMRSQSLLVLSLLLTSAFCFFGKDYPIFLSLSGLTMSVFFPSFMDWIAEAFPNNFQRVMRFAMAGIGAHLVLMHLSFGRIADSLGIEKAMNLPFILSFISLLLLLISLLNHRRITKKMRDLQ